MSAFGQKVARITRGVVRFHRDRGVKEEVGGLHAGDGVGDDIGRHILGNDGQSAASGDCLRHTPPGHRGHIRDDERNRRSCPVVGV